MNRRLPLLFLVVLLGASGNRVLAQVDYYKKDSVIIDEPRRRTVEEKQPVRAQSIEGESELAGLSFKERIRYGGNFGLRLGTFTNINVSPLVGYQITPKFTAGAGLTYMYFRDGTQVLKELRNDHVYGGRAFAMFSLFPFLNLVGEYEGLNVAYFDYKRSTYPYKGRTWLGSPMLGLSYTQGLNSGPVVRGLHLMFLYNFNYNNQNNPSVNSISNPESINPYGSPFVIRVTFY